MIFQREKRKQDNSLNSNSKKVIIDVIFRGVSRKHYFWAGNIEENKMKNIKMFNYSSLG